MLELKTIIEADFEQIHAITPQNANPELLQTIDKILTNLEAGSLRVAEKSDQGWIINTWVKKAILLYFRCHDNQLITSSFSNFFDKIPGKYANADATRFQADGIRAVPQAYVRKGTYIGKGTVLMPSFVNIGAYVGTGCMIDTWATVGSCAQIGKNVHLSGNAGIGGVLEPLQANPTIVEDDCFIGAGSQVVEGVIIEQGSVIATGVFIGQSTKIYDREKDQIFYGRVPAGSVVVAGSIPSKDGRCSTAAAIIVKTVAAATRAKVGINQLLHIVD